MTDDRLDEALRDLFAEEQIPPELADALVTSAQPAGRGPGWWMAGAALVAAVLALAFLPDPQRVPSEEGDSVAAPAAAPSTASVPEQARNTLGPCFDGFASQEPSERRTLGLRFDLEDGALAEIGGLELPDLDPVFADCVRDAAWEWTWPDQDDPVLLMVLWTPEGVSAWVPEVDRGVEAAARILELDDAGVAAARETALWDAEGLIPLDGPLDELTGTVIAAPTMAVPWGSQGEFYSGGALPEDGTTLALVPWEGDGSPSLQWRIQTSVDEPLKGRAELRREGLTTLGMLQETDDALLLITLQVDTDY